MSADGSLHAALMAQVKAITGYTLIWPGKDKREPDGEYIRVNHLPNDNVRKFLGNSAPLERKGFLVLVLCSPLGQHEAVYREKSGAIAETFFPLGQAVSYSSETLHIANHVIKPGRREKRHWETPIWIEYR